MSYNQCFGSGRFSCRFHRFRFRAYASDCRYFISSYSTHQIGSALSLPKPWLQHHILILHVYHIADINSDKYSRHHHHRRHHYRHRDHRRYHHHLIAIVDVAIVVVVVVVIVIVVVVVVVYVLSRDRGFLPLEVDQRRPAPEGTGKTGEFAAV